MQTKQNIETNIKNIIVASDFVICYKIIIHKSQERGRVCYPTTSLTFVRLGQVTRISHFKDLTFQTFTN